MKTLVLNVDRDNDFGRKAKVKTPIFGIKENVNAANKLGQADPEDSDLNAIFSAISIYKKYIQEKRIVEIADYYNYDNSNTQTDYYDVNFSFDLNLGKWNKEFIEVS